MSDGISYTRRIFDAVATGLGTFVGLLGNLLGNNWGSFLMPLTSALTFAAADAGYVAVDQPSKLKTKDYWSILALRTGVVGAGVAAADIALTLLSPGGRYDRLVLGAVAAFMAYVIDSVVL